MTRDEDDDAWVIALRYSRDYLDHVDPKSVVRMANCGHRVFMAPETVVYLEESEEGRGAYSVCTDCFEPMGDDVKGTTIPGLKDRLLQRTNVGVVDQIDAHLRDLGLKLR